MTLSGFLGGDVHVHGVYDKGDGTGILAVHYNASAKFENAVPEALAVISYNGDSHLQSRSCIRCLCSYNTPYGIRQSRVWIRN